MIQKFLLHFFAIAFCLVAIGTATAQKRPPNIVLIVSDDMGYADIGVHGSKDIPTPNIDSLAASGIRFTDAYVTGPYCSPTRAGLLTGRYPQRFGHEFNIPEAAENMEHGLPLTERTLADRLREVGYRTAIFGKWHLGAAEKFHPLSRGFDEFYGFLGGAHSYMPARPGVKNMMFDGRREVEEPNYLTDALAVRSVEFIKNNKEKPFFLYLAFNAVHTPMQAPDKYLERFPAISDPARRTYAAMLSAMDDGIGKVIKTIKDQGLERDTLIVFLNDNGGPTMQGTAVNASSNAPLKGSKRQTWEGGIRVAFMAAWKGRLPQGRVEKKPVIQLDIMPTVLAAAGVKVKGEWRLDGADLLPLMSGKSSKAPHSVLYWRLGEQMAIRKGNWKLVKSSGGRLFDVDHAVPYDISQAGLYDLKSDISEAKNVAGANPKIVSELARLWEHWNSSLSRPLWSPGARPRQN